MITGSKKIKHIIWDADGVLLDSFDSVLGIYAEMSASLNQTPFDRELAEKLMRENKTFTKFIKTLWGIDTIEGQVVASDSFTKIAALPEFLTKLNSLMTYRRY